MKIQVIHNRLRSQKIWRLFSVILKKNPNDSIRRASQVLKMPKSSFWKVLKVIWKYHAYKISTHQRLTEKSKERRKLFCKLICLMRAFRSQKVLFQMTKRIFMLVATPINKIIVIGVVIIRTYQRQSLHHVKVTAYASWSRKGIFLTFIESLNYFFPWTQRKRIIKKIYFMQDRTTPHRTFNVFATLHEVYGTRIIRLGYPKLSICKFAFFRSTSFVFANCRTWFNFQIIIISFSI